MYTIPPYLKRPRNEINFSVCLTSTCFNSSPTTDIWTGNTSECGSGNLTLKWGGLGIKGSLRMAFHSKPLFIPFVFINKTFYLLIHSTVFKMGGPWVQSSTHKHMQVFQFEICILPYWSFCHLHLLSSHYRHLVRQYERDTTERSTC